MSSSKSTVDFFLEQADLAHVGIRVRVKSMFGEYGVYFDNVFVGAICDDQLFVKQSAAGETYIKNPEKAPPYPGAKPHFLISEDQWEDPEWLFTLLDITAKELITKKKEGK